MVLDRIYGKWGVIKPGPMLCTKIYWHQNVIQDKNWIIISIVIALRPSQRFFGNMGKEHLFQRNKETKTKILRERRQYCGTGNIKYLLFWGNRGKSKFISGVKGSGSCLAHAISYEDCLCNQFQPILLIYLSKPKVFRCTCFCCCSGVP